MTHEPSPPPHAAGGTPHARDLLRDPVLLVACGLGSGLAPRAPGTVGSVLGVALHLAISSAGAGVPWQVGAAVLAAAIGVPLCTAAARRLGRADPPSVVFDEITGVLFALIAVPPGWGWTLFAFALFRILDILKPWPVSRLERLPAGLGIMLDDVAAGILALAVVQATAGSIAIRGAIWGAI